MVLSPPTPPQEMVFTLHNKCCFQLSVLQLCCIIHEYLDIVSIMHIINSRYITEITFHGYLHIFANFTALMKTQSLHVACCMSMFCYFTRCSSEFERSSFKWIPSHFPSISVAESLYLAEGNTCTLVAVYYKRFNAHLEQAFDKYTWLDHVRFRYTILDDWR